MTAAQPHGGGSSWTSWATHKAYTQVTVALEHDYGQPADTTTVASRVYAVTVTPTGRDHWAGTPTTTPCGLARPCPDWTRTRHAKPSVASVDGAPAAASALREPSWMCRTTSRS